MSEMSMPARSTAFRVGWWMVFAISALSVVNHVVLIFALPGEETLFLGWAALTLYSSLVLYFPYRQGASWAWYSIWILVVTYGLLILFDSEVGPYYAVAAALMALGQLLTRSSFSSKP